MFIVIHARQMLDVYSCEWVVQERESDRKAFLHVIVSASFYLTPILGDFWFVLWVKMDSQTTLV